MKIGLGLITIFSLLLLSFGVFSVHAQTPGDYAIDPEGSRISFKGESTLHPIKGEVRRFKGNFIFDTGPTASGEVVVEVESLLTENKGLDRNMHRMFRSREHPEAFCRIESLVIEKEESDGVMLGRLKAVLKIRDVEKPFESEVKVAIAGDKVVLKGQTVVSLKAFDLRPPTILGLIKMQDDIVVDFDVILNRR
jgi:polyisoprenoid-binding protein YceI